MGIYLRFCSFESVIKIVNLHPFQCTHWVLYFHERFFGSHGTTPPRNLSEFIIKRNGHCLFSDYKIQGLTGKGIPIVQLSVYT